MDILTEADLAAIEARCEAADMEHFASVIVDCDVPRLVAALRLARKKLGEQLSNHTLDYYREIAAREPGTMNEEQQAERADGIEILAALGETP